MGVEDVLQPAGLFNLVTLLAALALWWWRKPEGAPKLVMMVIALGTGFHFVTDLVLDLGVDGEHLLMHLVALAAVLAAAYR